MRALAHCRQTFGKTLCSTKRSAKTHPRQICLLHWVSTFQNPNSILICFCVESCLPRFCLCRVDFPFTSSAVMPLWWSCCLVWISFCLWMSQSEKKHPFLTFIMSSVTAETCISFEESVKFIGCFLELRELEVDEYVCLAKSWLVKLFPPLDVFLSSGFLGGSDGKASACNAGDLGSIPGWGRCPGEGNSNPLQDSCLENSHGQRSLVGHRPWGCTELAMTQQLTRPLSPALRVWCPPWPPSAFYSRGPLFLPLGVAVQE